MGWNIKTLVNSIQDIANKVIDYGKEVINKIDFNLTDIINQINAQTSKNLPPNSESYRVILTIDDCSDEFKNLNGINLVFDLVDSKSVTKSVDITTHPLVNGDLVGDHMYKNATTESLSGTFSTINSDKNWNKNSDGISSKLSSLNSSDYLSFIQELFEFLMDNGVMMTISTAKWQGKGLGATKVSRFKERNNMVLNSINWTEKYNSMDFSLSFQEVLAAGVQEAIPITENEPTLPSQTDAVPTTLGDIGMDDSELTKMVIKCFYDNGLVNSEFINAWGGALTAGVVGGALLGLAGYGVYTIIAAGAASGPVGWIALGLVAVAAIIAYTTYLIVDRFTRRYKNIKPFKTVYKNKNKSKDEYERFTKLIDGVVTQLKQATNVMKVYKIGSNTEQEMLLNFNNNSYVLKFTKNNTTGSHYTSLQVYDPEYDVYTLKTTETIKKGYYNLSIYDMTGASVGKWGSNGVIGSKDLIEAEGMELLVNNGHKLYLINTKLSEIEAKWNKKIDEAFINNPGQVTHEFAEELRSYEKQRKEELSEAQKDLSNFILLDCPFDIGYLGEYIEDTLDSILLNYKG